jgi:hypothetical protein
MRILLASLLFLCTAALLWQNAVVGQEKKEAQDKKEVTLKGKITCAKCELDVTPDCATVIVVKVEKKDVVYYFDKKGHEKHHDGVCSGGKEGTVTGIVADDGKKKTITVTSLKFKE